MDKEEWLPCGKTPSPLANPVKEKTSDGFSKSKPQQNAYENVIAWGQVPTPESRRAWQLWLCGSGFRVKDTGKGLQNLPHG